MIKRQPGIDMLRCLGLLFVNGVHAFLYNGFYSVPQSGAAIWAADCFRWLFFGCNGLFMMLTGYLKTNKPWNARYYRSLLGVLLGYLLTCVISFPIRHFLIGEKLTLYQWAEKMVTFGNYAWYVEMYIGLFLISPVINLALNSVQSPKGLLVIAGTMVFLTALPTATPIDLLPDYWTALYPVTYYVIGAVIQRLQPKVRPWLALMGVALVAMGLGLVSILSTDEGFSKGFTQGYGGGWITLMMTFLFLTLYRVNPGPTLSRVFAWAAGGVYEGYILSRLLDVWIYGMVPQWHHPETYPLIFLFVTIPVFVFSILAGKLTHLPVKLLLEQKPGKRERAKP